MAAPTLLAIQRRLRLWFSTRRWAEWGRPYLIHRVESCRTSLPISMLQASTMMREAASQALFMARALRLVVSPSATTRMAISQARPTRSITQLVIHTTQPGELHKKLYLMGVWLDSAMTPTVISL